MEEAQVTGITQDAAQQGLDEICLSNGRECSNVNEPSFLSGSDTDEEDVPREGNGVPPEGNGGSIFNEEFALNCIDDFVKININELSTDNILRYHFPDLVIAYLFYNWYGSLHGFGARKSKILWNCNGEAIQQTFLCHREGYRAEKQLNRVNKKREPKQNFRCGCEARCQVHVDRSCGRWYIKKFDDVHNHGPMDEKYTALLPAHRKMGDHEKCQMTTMREVGIRIPHIYGVFAKLAGGYENVGFKIKDMYNENERERRSEFSDAKVALDFLESMRKKDEMMFWRVTVDEGGRLEHLFWCDGFGRRDYSVFGDVLAFDATYRKNKYLCPLVVFSGVNHHNMSTVFACAIVGNESEETYVWLLKQFLEAMGGKCPMSIITDGDLAMRNAIRSVFPTAHHRLCAWHLIRNAVSNVKNPQFVSKFKKCMLGDFDIGEFNRNWEQLIAEFNLENNNWVKELYEKRKMWASAHIRGSFFAGFRTTSRCEGLHSEFGKYVNSHNNLTDFFQHFYRWLNYMRYKEVEADFSSVYGEVVVQTQLGDLERAAATLYTKEIFMLFRPVLERTLTYRVAGQRRTASTFLYVVTRYCQKGFEWRVSFCQISLVFKCSCQRFESLGLPCEHLLAVMVHLNIVVIPECLILKRWTKGAKDTIGVLDETVSSSRDHTLWSLYVALVEQCKEMAKDAYECSSVQHMRKTIEVVKTHRQYIKSITIADPIKDAPCVHPLLHGSLRNPVRVRTKGCGGSTSGSQPNGKQKVQKTRRCSVCGQEGHNRQSCIVHREVQLQSQQQVGCSLNYDSDDEQMNLQFDFNNINTYGR